MFAGKKSAQIREILINESAWEEMTCLFAPSLDLQWVLIDNQTAVCVTPEQLTLLGFTDEFIEKTQQNLIDGCYPIEKEKQITTYLDKGKMQLSISAPQAWLKYKDANWTPPELWNHGIARAFLDYNLYASHGNDSNLLIVFYVQIMPDDFVMQLHRF